MMAGKRNSILHFVVTGISAVVMIGCANTQTIEGQDTKPLLAQNPVETQPIPAPPPIVNYRHATLTDLNLNNLGNQVAIKPGRFIQATLNYAYNCPKCNPGLGNQIIIGLARRSAQACIYDGGSEGHGSANFELKVPAKPGKYDVRFRVLQAANCNEALKAGWGDDNSPEKETTIGMIIASKKAEG